MIAQAQFDNKAILSSYNVGPDENGCVSTRDVTAIFYEKWNELTSESLEWAIQKETDNVHEANFLKLDSSKIKKTIGWKPCMDIKTAIEKTVDWYHAYVKHQEVVKIMDVQIEEYVFKS